VPKKSKVTDVYRRGTEGVSIDDKTFKTSNAAMVASSPEGGDTSPSSFAFSQNRIESTEDVRFSSSMINSHKDNTHTSKTVRVHELK
jgi:hypothetical protein